MEATLYSFTESLSRNTGRTIYDPDSTTLINAITTFRYKNFGGYIARYLVGFPTTSSISFAEWMVAKGDSPYPAKPLQVTYRLLRPP